MGMSRLSVALGLVFTLLSAVAGAQQSDVQALLQECRARQVDRWNGVTHYVVDQSMMGNRVTLAYERFEAPGPDGKLYPGFRPLRQDSPYSTGDLALYSEGARRVGTGLSDEMAKAGFPAGMLGGAGADPWVSTDPEVMMGGAAAFVDAAAEAQEQNARERKAAVAEASESMSQLAEIAPQFRLVGTEAVQSRSARHLQARGLQRRLASEGDAQMVIDDVDLWIDESRKWMVATLSGGGLGWRLRRLAEQLLFGPRRIEGRVPVEHHQRQHHLFEFGGEQRRDGLRVGDKMVVGDEAELNVVVVTQDRDANADVSRLRHPEHALFKA